MTQNTNNRILALLFVGVLMGTLIASNISLLIGYKHVFWLIALCSIILTITAIFLKNRKSELLLITDNLE